MMNYHHLLYFWSVATFGSMTAASRRLRLAPQTLSAQIRALEDSLGQPLFDRTGGRLVLTDAGRLAMHYADEIFSLGTELREAIRAEAGSVRVRIGISETVPQSTVQPWLAPWLTSETPATLTCSCGPGADLAARLSAHHLDLVIADGPLVTGKRSRITCELIAECDVAIFAAPVLATRLRPGFPNSLDGAPVLLPLESAPLRKDLDRWFTTVGVHPFVKAEIVDGALMKTLACEGAGAFAAPLSIEREITRRHRLENVGVVPGVRYGLFAATFKAHRSGHPLVTAILERARASLERAPDVGTTAA